jgi:polysaccharide export outer membrane protein
MKKTVLPFLSVIMMTLLLCSCKSREKIVYIQGADKIGSFKNPTLYEAHIAKDNQLSILVTCSDLQLAVPFNLQRPQASMQEGGGSYSANINDNDNLYYRVDSNGDIRFPTIGKLHVEGMTRNQLSDYLTNYLSSKGYIADPIVNVSFTGAHYSVLGEVNGPGVIPMTQDRVTIFEALASAHDLTIFGERDKVQLLREENGEQKVISLNLKDPQIISSPYYFIKNGDVIYVEPSGTRAANREVSSLSSFAISVTSILITIASLIITVTK